MPAKKGKKKGKTAEYYAARDKEELQKMGGREAATAKASALRTQNNKSRASFGPASINDYVKDFEQRQSRRGRIRPTPKDLQLAKRITEAPLPKKPEPVQAVSGPRNVCFKKKNGGSVSFAAKKSRSFCK